MSSIESEKVAVETRLDGEKRDWEQKKRGMEMAVERQQEALVKMQSELEVSVRERENLEISLKAVREEVSGVWGRVTPADTPPSCVPWSTIAVTTWRG